MSLRFQNLLKKAKKGDNAAFKLIYIKYSEQLMSKSLRYATDMDMAKDILHDGFVKIYQNIARFEGNEKMLYGWMSKIIINEALKNFHKRSKTIFLEHHPGLEHAELEADIYQDMAVKEILKMIQELSEPLKVVFMLHCIDGYKHAEIATILGINIEASRVRLNRAKAQLRKNYNKSKLINHA